MPNEPKLRPGIMDWLEHATTFEIMSELKRRGFTQEMLLKAFGKAEAPPVKKGEYW